MARRAIPRLLEILGEYDVAATWAVVGFLFGGSRDEVEAFRPAIQPAYLRIALDPYREPVGSNEADDPLHFGRSLIERIQSAPRQEIATHTFSHYYCREPGQTEAAFRADLASAVAIAAASGISLQSVVFPRNQFNPDYAAAVLDSGLTCYRGAPLPPGRAGAGWRALVEPSGLVNVPASMFLRPHTPMLGLLEPLRLRWLERAMREAAAQKRVLHLWSQLQDFGNSTDHYLAYLEKVCRIIRRYSEGDGLRSLTMAGAARIALSAVGSKLTELRAPRRAGAVAAEGKSGRVYR
jgi:peptidoglycan/xylan/chitin deacetylase (PgdA/CDA1 family)